MYKINLGKYSTEFQKLTGPILDLFIQFGRFQSYFLMKEIQFKEAFVALMARFSVYRHSAHFVKQLNVILKGHFSQL